MIMDASAVKVAIHIAILRLLSKKKKAARSVCKRGCSQQEHDAERADAQRHMQLPNVCKELDGQRMALPRQSMVYVHHALDAKITQSLHRKRGNARGPPGSRLAR